MQTLSTYKDTLLDTLLQALPLDYQEEAYKQGAFTRSRKFKSVEDLFKLVMNYCCLDYSLRTCAGIMALTMGSISDTAIMSRLLPCMPWLKTLLSKVLSTQLVKMTRESPFRFLAIDASTIQVKGARSTSYRLHLAMDLITLSPTQIKITDTHQGENLSHYELDANDVVLLDRGYNQPKTLVPFLQKGGHVVLRYNPNGMTLYEPKKEGLALQRIDWLSEVNQCQGDTYCKEVHLTDKDSHIKAYVHLSRLPKAQAEKARRTLRRNAQRRQYTVSQEALTLAGWMFVLTTLPPHVVNTETIMSLYRTRWQIELVFKRLKSLLSLSELRAKLGSPLAEVYLYGKLLYAAMIECFLRKHLEVNTYSLYQEHAERAESRWRLWHLLHLQFMACFSFCDLLSPITIQKIQKPMRERRRKRKLQTMPENIITNLIKHIVINNNMLA